MVLPKLRERNHGKCHKTISRTNAESDRPLNHTTNRPLILE